MVYALPENVLKALLDYLSQRPYREVSEAMEVLTKLQEIKNAD